MALQVEQGSLVLETQLSSGGLRAEQSSLVLETSVPQAKSLRVEQTSLIIEIHAGNFLVQLTGGGYSDFLGNPLANGYLKMRLNTPSEVYSTGSEIIEGSEISFTIQLDSNGNVVTGQYVFANSSLTPNTSQYIVQAFAADGTTASAPQTVTVPADLVYSISNWVPLWPTVA